MSISAVQGDKDENHLGRSLKYTTGNFPYTSGVNNTKGKTAQRKW